MTITTTTVFKVSFKPLQSWADDTYFGNILTEMLGAWAKETHAFEFEVTKGEEGDAKTEKETPTDHR